MPPILYHFPSVVSNIDIDLCSKCKQVEKYMTVSVKVKITKIIHHQNKSSLPMQRRHESTASQLQWTVNPMLNLKLRRKKMCGLCRNTYFKVMFRRRDMMTTG